MYNRNTAHLKRTQSCQRLGAVATVSNETTLNMGNVTGYGLEVIETEQWKIRF